MSKNTTYYSDARLKHDIKLTAPVLERLKTVNVVDYKMNNDRSDRQRTGLIAQNLMVEFPQMVEGTEDSYYSVNYPKMVAVAIKAIQELTAKVEQLETIIKSNGITE